MGVDPINDCICNLFKTCNRDQSSRIKLILRKKKRKKQQQLKVRGPFVQTLCIEKDSYMDTI